MTRDEGLLACNYGLSGSRSDCHVKKAIEYMKSNYCYPIKITDVATHLGINRSYLYTLFMKSLFISPHQYLATLRINKAVEYLRMTDNTIESIALSCGYKDALVFTKAFKQMKNITPSNYRGQPKS